MTIPDWLKPQNAGNAGKVHPRTRVTRVTQATRTPATRETPRTRVTRIRADLGLTLVQMSRYMGVPYRTYIKWEHGQRAPGAVATRLLDILELVQANAPALHDDLLTEARTK